MRKFCILVCLLAALSLSIPAFGQQFENTIQGSITTSGADCTTAGACVELRLPLGVGSGSIGLSQTFSGTVQFEASADHINWFSVLAVPPNSQTAVTSATTANTWVVRLSGFRYLRARASALASGRIKVFLLGSTATISVLSIA